ncbi:hypothetical protein [Lacticaseibacillus paracasei]|uniref:hypothetical protein n=1 Tax=Lacticaseibacillus paracasei TaxID=1597 RepID=UPI00194DC51F|nr:hypothetical protein [Lacticaseibacillus paracasei]MBM6411861.1 hypothetical protein [Lacticaseibacillus paracasei]
MRLVVAISFAALLAAAIARAADVPPPGPAPHMLPVTDDDLAVLDQVAADIGKLCPVSDADCIAQVKMHDMVRRWVEALKAQPPQKK